MCSRGKRGLNQALGVRRGSLEPLTRAAHSSRRSRGGFSTKIHALSDGLGNPLELALTGGAESDVTQAPGLLLGKQAKRVIADKGYDAHSLVVLIEQQGAAVVIPPRKNCKQPRKYDSHEYKARHLIECLFSKMKQYRRVFSRFDKLARNYWSFCCFVCALLWLR